MHFAIYNQMDSFTGVCLFYHFLLAYSYNHFIYSQPTSNLLLQTCTQLALNLLSTCTQYAFNKVSTKSNVTDMTMFQTCSEYTKNILLFMRRQAVRSQSMHRGTASWGDKWQWGRHVQLDSFWGNKCLDWQLSSCWTMWQWRRYENGGVCQGCRVEEWLDIHCGGDKWQCLTHVQPDTSWENKWLGWQHSYLGDIHGT